jgi:hypothetical protein
VPRPRDRSSADDCPASSLQNSASHFCRRRARASAIFISSPRGTGS